MCYIYSSSISIIRIMFEVILKNKFREKKIHLSRAVRVMYKQPFTGSIQSEHIKWWKKYLIKIIYQEILYPKEGWIQLFKIYRDGKPSVRVVTVPISSSFGRGLLVLNKLYGEEEYNEQKRKTYKQLDTRRM